MKKLMVLFCFNCLCIYAFAQQQRALLIGINRYAPPENFKPALELGRVDFPNLEGCRNDLEAIYSNIISRFNFQPDNIDTLVDEAATRDAILSRMNTLLEKSKAGDIAFIYYAGHGSRVRNSLSKTKADKMDETIVPADVWQYGVRDIRDKELSVIFNKFLDKKIKLTVIFDCCHSGSISRGPNLVAGKLRFMPDADWDSKDTTKPATPELRDGFLIISAAQSNETAAEVKEQVQEGVFAAHGAFTYAFIQALQQEPSDLSAAALFASTRAILKNNGASQEPVIGGTSRKNETLFGIKKGQYFDYSIIPVSKIRGGKIELDGGWALGLNKENELAYLNEKNNKDTLYKLKIENVIGVNKSLASVIKGNIDSIRPGQLFRVCNWVSSDLPLLNVYMPQSNFSTEEVKRITKIASQIKNSGKVKWLENLKMGNPYTTVFYVADKCFIKLDKNEAIEIKNLTLETVLSHCKMDSTIYFEIPVSSLDATKFTKIFKQCRNLNLVENIDAAHYTLFGKMGKNFRPAYGLRKIQISPADSLESMPLFSDCFEQDIKYQKSIGDSLVQVAQKLSKIRGWLNVVKTPDGTKKDFPYHLEIVNETTKKIENGAYKIGDSISFHLVLDKDFHNYKNNLPRRYIYIFAVDQSGSMALYFPRTGGNDVNQFPKYVEGQPIDNFPLGISYKLEPPTGTDNFFVLASGDPIPNPDLLFHQEGVNSAVISRGTENKKSENNSLAKLLDLGNYNNSKEHVNRGDADGSREGRISAKMPVANWTILKFSYSCTY